MKRRNEDKTKRRRGVNKNRDNVDRGRWKSNSVCNVNKSRRKFKCNRSSEKIQKKNNVTCRGNSRNVNNVSVNRDSDKRKRRRGVVRLNRHREPKIWAEVRCKLARLSLLPRVERKIGRN